MSNLRQVTRFNSPNKIDITGTTKFSATTTPLTIIGLQSGVGTPACQNNNV